MKKLPVMVMTAALMLTTAGCGNTIKGHEDISEITDSSVNDVIGSMIDEATKSAADESAEPAALDDPTGPAAPDESAALDEPTESTAPDEPDYLWVLDGQPYTKNIKLSQYEGEVTLNLETLEEEESDPVALLKITQNDTVLAQTKLLFFPDNIKETLSYKNIDEIGITDSNFDGKDDIIIIGETDRGRELSICEYEKAYYEGSTDYLNSNDNFGEAIAEKLGDDISVKSINELLYGPDFDGSFKTYSDAYKTVIAVSRLKYGEEDNSKYGLVYFNDDEIPDLVIDRSGYHVSLYIFENGRVHCPVYEWGYGAGGNAGYEFYEKSAVVTNFNQDFAGAIYYYTYFVMNDNYEMVESYGLKGYNFDDLNGNGTPEEDETTDEALLNAEGKIEYFDYTDENLSEEEIEKKMDAVSGSSMNLSGDLTFDELLKELE